MRLRLGLSLGTLALLACSTPSNSGGQPARGITFIVPDDLAKLIQKITLSIYPSKPDAGGMITCDPATGTLSGPTKSVTPYVYTDFSMSGCTGGATYCSASGKGALSQPQSTIPQIFLAVGTEPGGTPVATGCAQLTLSQPNESLTIKLLHVVPSHQCGNGMVEATETCDDTTPACDHTTCQTVEELLSYGDISMAGTSTGSAGQKTNPFFLWGSGPFVAVYTDGASTSGQPQVGLRVMDANLDETNNFGSVAGESSLYLPNSTTVFPPTPSPDTQKQPSAATVGSNTYVVFSDDNTTTSDSFDIHFRSFSNSDLNAQQGGACPVNDAGGGVNSLPSIAASSAGTSFFVAWQDSSGNVSGRMITPGSGCGVQATQPAPFGANSTTGPRVAAAGSGWVVAWADSGTIKTQLFDGTGALSGGTQMIGSGSSPVVASSSTPMGVDFAVAWADSGGSKIRVARFDQNGNGIQGSDANATVNTTAGSVSTPAIAGGPQTSGFYAVSWISQGSSGTTLRSRLVSATAGQLGDNSGYLFNNIDSQADDFLVNVSTGRPLANPTIAVGGSGYIAYGWEDHGGTCASPTPFPGTPCWGVIARRFPTPTE